MPHRKNDTPYPVDISKLTLAEKDAILAEIRAQSLPSEQAMDKAIQEHICQEQQAAAERGPQTLSEQAGIAFI